jgi:hypothetical protein
MRGGASWSTARPPKPQGSGGAHASPRLHPQSDQSDLGLRVALGWRPPIPWEPASAWCRRAAPSAGRPLSTP